MAQSYGSSTVSSVEDAAAARVKAKAAEVADRAQEKLGEAADAASERAKHAGDAVRQYTHEAADKIEGSVRQYPLTALLGAAAVGLVLGAIFKR